MPSKKRHSVLFTGILSLICCTVVGMSCLNFYHKLQDKEYAAQQQSLMTLAEQVACTVESTLDGYFNTLYGIAEFLGTSPLVTEEKLRHLAQLAQRENLFRLGLVSLDGILTVSDGQQVDVSDRPYFQNILQGKIVLTGVRDSRLTNDKMFILTVPIRGAEQKLMGALHCSFPLEDFSLQAKLRLYQGGRHHTHIIDRQGKIILPCGEHEASWTGTAIYDHMKQTPNGVPLDEVRSRVSKGKAMMTEIIARETVPMMAYFMPLQRNNWSCLITLPTSEADRHLNLLLDQDVLILLLNVLGSMGVLTLVIILQLRRTAEEEKNLRQGLLANVLGFMEADLDADRILHCSETPLLQSIKSKPFSEAVQYMVAARVHEDFRENLIEALSRERIRQMFDDITHSHTVDFMAISDNHELIWMECKINIKEDPSNGHLMVYCILRDINDKKESEAILRKRAERDALTGLYNRTAGSELIDNYLKSHSYAENLHAFIIFDLDNFKDVNDKLGHLVGDQALKDTAQTFVRHFRKEDILCRLGGDEFVVFMKDVTLDMVEKKLDSVLSELRLSYSSGSTTVSISGSAGFALAPRDGKFFKELYPRADSALYIVKDNTKGGYCRYGADF